LLLIVVPDNNACYCQAKQHEANNIDGILFHGWVSLNLVQKSSRGVIVSGPSKAWKPA